jgi:hypothetical protein
MQTYEEGPEGIPIEQHEAAIKFELQDQSRKSE